MAPSSRSAGPPFAEQILGAIGDGQKSRLVPLHRDDVFERLKIGAEALRDLAGGVELEDVSGGLRPRVALFVGVFDSASASSTVE